ncbi:MAG: hypothetical protein K6C68_14045 [Ruminococcus sp.]|nr:hypothetical protein [Ruminococcus sp.]
MKNRKYLISLVIPFMLTLFYYVLKRGTRYYVFSVSFWIVLVCSIISTILILVYKVDLTKKMTGEAVLIFVVSGMWLAIADLLTLFMGGMVFGPLCAIGTSFYLILKSEKPVEKIVCFLLNPYNHFVFFLVDHSLTASLDFDRRSLPFVVIDLIGAV